MVAPKPILSAYCHGWGWDRPGGPARSVAANSSAPIPTVAISIRRRASRTSAGGGSHTASASSMPTANQGR